MIRKSFNWKAAIVLVLSFLAIAFSFVVLHQWKAYQLEESSYQEGLRYYEDHDWEKAALNFGRYLAVNHNDIQILLKYADAQLNIRPLMKKNIQYAIAAYRSIIRLDKDNSFVAEKLISLYLDMDIASEAELIARRYLQNNVDSKIGTLLAMAMVRQRKFTEAYEYLQNIVSINPQEITAYEVLAQLIEARPEHYSVDAEYWLNEAVQNNPYSADAYIARAAFYVRNEDFAKAVIDLKEAEKMELSDTSIHIRMVTELANVQDYKKAVTHLNQISLKDPKDLNLWQTWAEVSLQAGTKKEMLDVAAKGLNELGYKEWDFWPLAVELFIKGGDLANAAKYISKLNQSDSDLARKAFLGGLLAEAQNQDYKAIAFWKQAIQFGNKSQRIYLLLAEAYSRKNDSQSAIHQLRTLISIYPTQFIGHFNLAKSLIVTGKFSEAAKHAHRAMQLAPDNFEAVLLYTELQINLAKTIQINNEKKIVSKQVSSQLERLEDSGCDINKLLPLKFQLALLDDKYVEAEQLLTSLKSCKYDAVETGILEVELLITQNKIGEAVSMLHEMTELYPEEILIVKYLVAISNEYSGQAECEKILVNAFERVEDVSARRDVAISLAGLYFQQDQEGKGCQILEEILQEIPHDISVKRELLKFEKVRDDKRLSQNLIDQIRSIEGDHGWQWRYEQAHFFFEGGGGKDDYPRIITLLKENLEFDPADQTSRLLLAATYDKANELQLAITVYREALDNSPRDLNVIIPTIKLLYKANEYKQAEEIMKYATRQNLKNFEISKLKLQSCLRFGRLNAAEEILIDLSLAEPENRTILLSLALLKMQEKEFVEAHALLNKLMVKEPGSFSVAAAMVKLKTQQGEYKKAIEICDEIIKRHPNAPAHVLRGKTYLMTDQKDLASEDFERAVLIEPDNAHTWVAKSDFNYLLGHVEKSLEDLQVALSLAPENLWIQKLTISTSLAYGGAEKIQQGANLLDSALSCHPKDIQLRSLKAKYLLNEETSLSNEQAESLLQEITEEQPKFEEAWVLWADMNLKQGKLGKALDIVIRGLSYSPENKKLLLLKAKTEASGSPALAIPTLRVLIENEPDNYDIKLMLARAYLATDQYGKSISILQEIAISSGESDALDVNTVLAVALYKSGKKELAKRKLDLLYQSKVSDPKIFSVEANLLKEDQQWDLLCKRIDDWFDYNDDAINVFVAIADDLAETRNENAMTISEYLLRKILHREPKSISALKSLAILLQASGKYLESTQIYERVLELNPESPVAINNLAWIMCEVQKDYMSALELAQTGLQQYPDYVDLIDTRGTIYYRLGENHKAVHDFVRAIELSPENSQFLVIAYFHLARTFIALGYNNRAVDSLQKSLGYDNKNNDLSMSESSEARSLLRKLLTESSYVPIVNR